MYDEPDSVIRITKEEALGSHVDDLLNRQRSLRGDRGVDKGEARWYYRSWFVLAITGLVSAFAAWAIIEPRFDDMAYVQGQVHFPSPDGEPTIEGATTTTDRDPIRQQLAGVLRIGDNEFVLSPFALEIGDDDKITSFDRFSLTEGQEIGVHAELSQVDNEFVGLVHYVNRSPSPADRTLPGRTLREIARAGQAIGILFFAIVAGVIGLGIGAVDGIICRLPRRAILAGLIGLAAGAIGGLFSGIVASALYVPLAQIAADQMQSGSSARASFGFLLQVIARALAWAIAGSVSGLGQGIALRSSRLVLFAFIGGVVGGLLGGLLFDPIDQILLHADGPSSAYSRLAGLLTIGASVGAMIGVVELFARESWLRMIEGPLAGKEFILFKDVLQVGSSPSSDIYLFNDDDVAAHHATLRTIGDETELERLDPAHPILLNGLATHRARLRSGDQITIGTTTFVFQTRQA